MEVASKKAMKARVESALDTVRDFLHADGGDVELVDIEKDMTVKIRLLGACRSCQMSAMTMKAGIEDAIRRAVPEVKSVEAIQEENSVME